MGGQLQLKGRQALISFCLTAVHRRMRARRFRRCQACLCSTSAEMLIRGDSAGSALLQTFPSHSVRLRSGHAQNAHITWHEVWCHVNCCT